jgi:hypothetical protein
VQLSRLALAGAIGVSLASAVAFVSQATTSPAISPALRSHLQGEQFQVVTSVRGLPLGVRERMQQLFGSSTLDIADPGANFRRSDASGGPRLPRRRLIVAGCAADSHCLIYYERGGATLTRRVMLYHWTPAETRFEWGAPAPGGFSTIEDVRRAIGSGAIKGGPTDPW